MWKSQRMFEIDIYSVVNLYDMQFNFSELKILLFYMEYNSC